MPIDEVFGPFPINPRARLAREASYRASKLEELRAQVRTSTFGDIAPGGAIPLPSSPYENAPKTGTLSWNYSYSEKKYDIVGSSPEIPKPVPKAPINPLIGSSTVDNAPIAPEISHVAENRFGTELHYHPINRTLAEVDGLDKTVYQPIHPSRYFPIRRGKSHLSGDAYGDVRSSTEEPFHLSGVSPLDPKPGYPGRVSAKDYYGDIELDYERTDVFAKPVTFEDLGVSRVRRSSRLWDVEHKVQQEKGLAEDISANASDSVLEGVSGSLDGVEHAGQGADRVLEDVGATFGRGIHTASSLTNEVIEKAKDLQGRPIHEVVTDGLKPMKRVGRRLKRMVFGGSKVQGPAPMTNAEHRSLETLLSNTGSKMDPVRLDEASVVVERIDNPDTLMELGRRVNPAAVDAAVGTADPIDRMSRLRAILHEHIGNIPREDTVADGLISTVPLAAQNMPGPNTPGVTNIKNQLYHILRKRTADPGLYKNVPQSGIQTSLDQGYFRPQNAGIPSINDVGLGGEGRRVFDPIQSYSLDSFEAGLSTLDKVTGRPLPGIANMWGVSAETIAEMRKMGIESIGPNITPGTRSASIVSTVLKGGRTLSGERIYKRMKYLTIQLTDQELKAQKMLRVKKSIGLDLETTMQGRRGDTLDELLDEQLGGGGQAANIFTSRYSEHRASLSNLTFEREYASAISSGDNEHVIGLYNQMMHNPDIDKISQVSMRLGEREGENLRTMREGLFGWGGRNVGIRSGQAIYDKDFTEVIDKLGSLIGKSYKEQGKNGELWSDSVIMGPNVGRFDLERLRAHAASLGEKELAEANIRRARIDGINTEMPNLRTISLGEMTAEQQSATERGYGQIKSMRSELEYHQRIADTNLSFSGRSTAVGTVNYEGEALTRWTGGRYKATSGYDLSMGMVRDENTVFRTHMFGDLNHFADEAETKNRIKAYMTGIGATDYGAPAGWGGQQELAFGTASDAFELRMTKMQNYLSPHNVEKFLHGAIEDVNGGDARYRGLVLDSARRSQIDRAIKEVFGDRASKKGILWPESRPGKIANNLGLKTKDERDYAEAIWNRSRERFSGTGDAYAGSMSEELFNSAIGSPASADQVFFQNSKVFGRTMGGESETFRTIDGKIVETPLRDLPTHVASRDTALMHTADDVAEETLQSTGALTFRAMSPLSDSAAGEEEDSLIGRLGENLRLVIMNVFKPKRGEGQGASSVAMAALPEGILVNGEEPGEKIAAASIRMLGQVSSKSATDPGALEAATLSIGNGIKSIFPNSEWANNPEIVDGISAVGLLAAGGIAVGAIATLAVTNIDKNRDDDAWRYQPTERAIDRKLRRRSDVMMGQFALESSNRRNYSYNQRPDRHKHLFGGR